MEEAEVLEEPEEVVVDPQVVVVSFFFLSYIFSLGFCSIFFTF